ERTVRAKYESTNIVVVMMMVMMPVVVPAIRAAFAFVIVVVMAMIVAMVVIVVVIVGSVRVFCCQKLRIDIQDGVEVETADIQQGLDVGLAEMNRMNRCTWVDLHQPRTQCLVIGIGDQVFFGNQDDV